jgi:hypothetical protein
MRGSAQAVDPQAVKLALGHGAKTAQASNGKDDGGVVPIGEAMTALFAAELGWIGWA